MSRIRLDSGNASSQLHLRSRYESPTHAISNRRWQYSRCAWRLLTLFPVVLRKKEETIVKLMIFFYCLQYVSSFFVGWEEVCHFSVQYGTLHSQFVDLFCLFIMLTYNLWNVFTLISQANDRSLRTALIRLSKLINESGILKMMNILFALHFMPTHDKQPLDLCTGWDLVRIHSLLGATDG